MMVFLYFSNLAQFANCLTDKVKKVIFDGGGIPTLIRIFSTNQPEIFAKIAQLLHVMTSNGISYKIAGH